LKVAIFVSSLLFSILHLDPIGSFVFAFVMCVLYIETRCLILPIACHAMNNVIAIGLDMMIPQEELDAGQLLSELSNDLWIATGCLIVSVPWLVIYCYRHWPQKGWIAPYFVQETDFDSDPKLESTSS